MEIQLPPALEKWIEEQVRAGHYPTAGEVVREALWRLRTETIGPEAAAEEFRADLEERLASLDRGEWVDPAEVFAELQRKSAERRRKTA